jgi:hypothetical protein
MRPKTSRDVLGASELDGVQGVAGSNPAVPTISMQSRALRRSNLFQGYLQSGFESATRGHGG